MCARSWATTRSTSTAARTARAPALVYLRQHGDRVRTAILDGVAPTNMRLPLFFPRDVQRAFDLLAKDCESDDGCNKAYPNLGERMRALIERLEKNPPTVKVTHPRTGETRRDPHRRAPPRQRHRQRRSTRRWPAALSRR